MNRAFLVRAPWFPIAFGGISFAVLFFADPVLAATCANTANSSGLHDPLCFTNIYDFVQKVLEAFVALAIPILSFFVIYAGFKYVMAQGNSAKLKDAHENFKWLVIGAALILGAWTLALLIKDTVNSVTGVGEAPSAGYTEYV